MRYALALAAAVAACLLVPTPASANDGPLICVITGRVGVGDVWSYDPPDPCLL